jgi:hypothetical protein
MWTMQEEGHKVQYLVLGSDGKHGGHMDDAGGRSQSTVPGTPQWRKAWWPRGRCRRKVTKYSTWYSAVTESMVATRVMQMVRRNVTRTITIHSCRLPGFTWGFLCYSKKIVNCVKSKVKNQLSETYSLKWKVSRKVKWLGLLLLLPRW